MIKNLKHIVIAGILLGMVISGVAETKAREWASADGSQKFSGTLINVRGGKVELKNSSDRKVVVLISKLSAVDQEYLAAHAKDALEKRRAADRQVSVPHKQGEIVGAINAGGGSSYFLYLPKSLVKSRKAPLLFYTHSGGGSKNLFKPLIEAAEINGWILAMSVESANKYSGSNLQVSKQAVDHILDSLPVDDDRLYFTGNSGGGAQAFENGDAMDACGLMPNVGYIPPGTAVPDGDCFIMNGGQDYNRYISAHARKQIGDSAVHRLHGGGHGKAPGWLMEDAMFWLEGRYCAREAKGSADERADYVLGMFDWIERNKQTNPHRAYYWALFLRDELKLSSSDKATAQSVIDELGKDRNNALYVEGLKAIDKLSVDKLSSFGSGSLHKHSDPRVNSICRNLLSKYEGVPVIEDTLKAIMSPTK